MAYLKLLLIRHAQSIGNTQRRMEGQSSTALTDLGQQQAKRLAHSLVLATVSSTPDRSPISWPTHLYSSPLQRAQQTAQPLIDALQQSNHRFQAIVDSRLQEIHQGIFQGLTWPEAQAQFPDLCAQLMSQSEWHPVPAAESPTEASARSHRWLQHILRTHPPGDTIWAISHVGIMLHLIAELMGCNHTQPTEIAHTATFEFWLSKPSANASPNPEEWVLKRFNQVISPPLAASEFQPDRATNYPAK